MARSNVKGVFCLEGNWSDTFTDKISVEPLLRTLEGQNIIRAVRRDVGTKEELFHYLRRWTRKEFADFPLGFFAFHGDKNCISLDEESVTLDELGEELADLCSQRVLYFGSCLTMKVTTGQLATFRKRTDAVAVCGYTKSIDWLESAAFEILLIHELTKSVNLGAIPSRMERNYPGLAKRLGFRLAIKSTSG
jgi:hypothetical protein